MKLKHEIAWIVRTNEFLRKLPETWELAVNGKVFLDDETGTCLKKFQEFHNLKILYFQSPNHLDFILPLCLNLNVLQLFDEFISPDDLELVSQLSRLEELSMEIKVWDPLVTESLARLSQLTALKIKALEFNCADLLAWKNLKHLKSIEVSLKSQSSAAALRVCLGKVGLMEQRAYDVTIGDWYESGKEIGCREYASEKLAGGYPLSFKTGDHLEIFAPDGSTLFSQTLTVPERDYSAQSLWYPEGVAVNDWDNWFNLKYRARVTLWESKPGYTVMVNSLN
jgi:hypothetical protein